MKKIPKIPPYLLRSSSIYWDEKDVVMQRFITKGVDLSALPDNIQHLIKELDRRNIQLSDKIEYELEN